MAIINNLPDLLAERFADTGGINLQRIADETGLTHATVSKWVKRRITRYDEDSLNKWCKYLRCTVGDILEYRSD